MTQSSLPPDHALARRTILKGASVGVGAGLVSGLTSTAQAQTTGAGTPQASEGPIWSAEYWAKKGEVKLNLWRKRVGAPKPGEHRCQYGRQSAAGRSEEGAISRC
jgi:hypothetical protein